jgi:hypothetical protein
VTDGLALLGGWIALFVLLAVLAAFVGRPPAGRR